MQTTDSVHSLMISKPKDGFGAIVKNLYHHVFNYVDFKFNKSLLKNVIDIEMPLDIYAGTNQLAKVAGKKKLSVYLNCAGSAFSEMVSKSLPQQIQIKEVPPDDELLILDEKNELICLGGPVANTLGGSRTGYEYEQLEDKSWFPSFKSNAFRWGFRVGDNQFGGFEGKKYFAKRCEDGVVVERPLYAIIDHQSKNNYQYFSTDSNGFLKEEVLLITKIENEFNKDRSILVIGGMHGYSIREFALTNNILKKNMSELKNRINKANAKTYQIYLPVYLEHKSKGGIYITNATLDWDRLELEKLS